MSITILHLQAKRVLSILKRKKIAISECLGIDRFRRDQGHQSPRTPTVQTLRLLDRVYELIMVGDV